jgi:uncharacterized phage protein gp47/JayE
MSTIDENGATLDDYTTVRAALITKFQGSFGANIKTDDQSVFGMLASIMSEVITDQNDLIREAINARNPGTATGTHLSNIVQFNGLVRRNPSYSAVALTVVANTAGTTIPAGSLVQDPNDSSIEFETDAQVVLGASATGTVSATATTIGAVAASSGTLTKIVNPVFGWASVTNAADAVVGESAETSTDLRSRRKSVSRQHGLQTLEAIYRALTNIDSIGRCSLFENNTSQIDSHGQIGHSVWAVCQGGADADIAEAIYKNKSAGIYTHGSTPITHNDPESGDDYIINFDRVSEIETEIYLKIHKLTTYPADGDTLIKAALVDYYDGVFVMSDGETNNGFGIGEDVEYFRLLTAVNSVGGFKLDIFTLGLSGGTLGIVDLPMARTELATLTTADITIDAY